MNTLKKIWLYISKLSLTYKIVGAVVIVGVVSIGVHSLTRPSDSLTPPAEVTHVQVSSVASLSDKAGPLPVTGKVTSINKANILAVSSGEIVSLSHTLGDYVSAGSVIASFENSSQRAAVMQAQGGYDGAKAALAKASGSTAQNSGLGAAQATQAVQNASLAANSALRGSYTVLDDAVHTKADALFTNPHDIQPKIISIIYGGQIITDVQNERVGLDSLLDTLRTLSTSATSTDVDANITLAISKAHVVEKFMNDLATALSNTIPVSNSDATAIAGYQASIAAGRTAVTNTISSLTSAKSAYDSAVISAAVAGNSADQGVSNDIASAQANVTAALGALNAAQSNLEKTIIRAPISGTIVSLPITRGGYVSSFSQVAQISNPGALEVEAYVTSDDAKTLAVGGKATIGGSATGVIVFIAPALDPTTGKIQVKLGISDKQDTLTDGDTVAVSLERSLVGGSTKSTKKAITIPIAAAKITPQGPIIFTVSSSTLVAVPVTFGPIVGNQVTILTGLSLDMDIVTDARGLSDGEIVVVDLAQ